MPALAIAVVIVVCVAQGFILGWLVRGAHARRRAHAVLRASDLRGSRFDSGPVVDYLVLDWRDPREVGIPVVHVDEPRRAA